MASLTKSDVNGGSPLDLGRIESENTDLTNGLTTLPIPLEESSQTKLFDFSGKVRKITITGKKTGTMSQLVTFAQTLDLYINTGQELYGTIYTGNTGTRYASGQDGAVMRVNYTFTGGIMTAISYTIEFVEGDIITG